MMFKSLKMTPTQLALSVVTIFLTFNSIKIEASLYSTNDTGITILDVDNFSDYVKNKGNIFVVEFYSSWCGHCIRFAPKFKSFAADIANWKSVIEVAAIDCADTRNVLICSNYEIQAYPTIKYLWRNFNPSTKTSSGNIVMGEGHAENPEILRHNLLDYVSSHLSVSTTDSWPYLMPLTPTSVNELLLLTANFTNNTILAYVEDASSYVGREVILDLVGYREHVHIIRLLDSDNSSVRQLLPPSKNQYLTPLLLQVNHRNQSVKALLTALEMPLDRRSFIVKYIKKNFLKQEMLYPVPPQSLEIEQNNSKKTPPVYVKTQIYISDLYLGLRYTFFNQIPLHGELNANEINILKRFLGILEKYFPFDDEMPRKFISAVKAWIETKAEHLEMDLLVEMLKSFDKKYPFPEPIDWVDCKGSETRYRGYPCSLWLLYHTLTAIEYEKTSVDPKWSNLHEVLYTMRDHINTFFSCTDCARNFISTSKDLESTLVFPNSSVLWLWKTHNKVNKRLHGDLTEDPQHPKSQFPSQEICSSCHHPTGAFDESKVLDFLLDQYGSQHIVKRYLVNVDHSTNGNGIFGFGYDHDSKIPGSLVIGWPTVLLNRVDISICVLIYLLACCILFMLFFTLSIKRRKRKDAARSKMSV